MPQVSAFVLAGGRSTRMGRDKAFLAIGGRTLLARALELARAITDEVSIVGARETFAAHASVVEDVFAGQGPLAGIHAALRASRNDLNLVLAVDAPFVDAAFLRYLVTRAQTSQAAVTAPRTDENGRRFLHPLCAVYRRAFADVAEAALQAGRNKIDALFEAVEVDVVGPEEIVRLGFDPAMFRNLNSPEDVKDL